MEDHLIRIMVEEESATRQLEVPAGINLSLMEVLKASDYPIAATCGGMALCATCHIEVIAGMEKLNPVTDAEMEMMDTLPNATNRSRLACQVRLTERLNGLQIRLSASPN